MSITAEQLHDERPEMTADEVEQQLRELLAKGMIIAICGDDGPTRFELTHNGRRAMENAR